MRDDDKVKIYAIFSVVVKKLISTELMVSKVFINLLVPTYFDCYSL